MSWRMTEDGDIIFVFRYLDEFNHYGYRINKSSNDDVDKFHQIYRLKNDKKTVLAHVSGKGFNINTWYRMVIAFDFNKIDIWLSEETSPMKPGDLSEQDRSKDKSTPVFITA